MRPEFKDLRRKLLDRSLEPYRAARKVQRPPKGWVRAIREGIGVSARELGGKLGGSRQLVLQQEKAEANDRITLKSLRMLADALDCELVYALVPRADSMQALIEDRARVQAKKNVLGVQHSMALEGQAVGDVDQAIETETKRLTTKRSTL